MKKEDAKTYELTIDAMDSEHSFGLRKEFILDIQYDQSLIDKWNEAG